MEKLIKWVWENRSHLESVAKGKERMRVRDERNRSHGNDYFLVSLENNSYDDPRFNSFIPEGCTVTLILIGGAVWQYNFCDTHCKNYVSLVDFITALKKIPKRF